MIAFLDRLHAYLPGWEIPKLTPSSFSKDYGFVTDYFCEIMHELRRQDVFAGLRSRFELVDAANTAQGVSGHDQRAVFKTASGMLKLLHPHGQVRAATGNRCCQPKQCGGVRNKNECLPIVDAFRTFAVCPPPALRAVFRQIQEFRVDDVCGLPEQPPSDELLPDGRNSCSDV